MRVASLFSGCGGLDLGLEQAGHEIILQVLHQAFPGVLLLPDVCAIQSLPLDTELLTAGFPCIDISRAGLRAGLDGGSSGLVRHVFRLLAKALEDKHPVPWVLLENVEALLDRAHGAPPAVQRIVTTLEQLGYNWAHRVVTSAAFGVPNRRKRVFILASLHGDPRDVLLAQGAQKCIGGSHCRVGADCADCYNADDRVGMSEDAIMHCSYALDLGNAQSEPGVDIVPTFTTQNNRICLMLSNGKCGMLRIEDAERLQGLPEGHTEACFPLRTPGLEHHKKPVTKDTDAGVAERRRFQLIGNAVTVPVAKWLGERLMQPYAFKYMATPDRDGPMPDEFQAKGLPDSVKAELAQAKEDLRTGLYGKALLLRPAGKPDDNHMQGALLPGVPEPANASDSDSGNNSEAEARHPQDPSAMTLEHSAAPNAPARLQNGMHHQQVLPPEAHTAHQHASSGSKQAAVDQEPAQGDAGLDEASVGQQHGAQTGKEQQEPGDQGEHRQQQGQQQGQGRQDQLGVDQVEMQEEVQQSAEQEQGGEQQQGCQQQQPQPQPQPQKMKGAGRPRGSRRKKRRRGAAPALPAPAPGTKYEVHQHGQGCITREDAGWPQAAWYMKGQGRHAAKDVSHSPLKDAFVPLGDFIKETGVMPREDSIHRYCMRLKEHGWHINRMVRKALQCGLKLDEQVAGILQLPGISDDACRIGDLVWALRTHSSNNRAGSSSRKAAEDIWWPAEAVDPFAPPRGFQLTAKALLQLPPHERAQFVPAVMVSELLPDGFRAASAGAMAGDVAGDVAVGGVVEGASGSSSAAGSGAGGAAGMANGTVGAAGAPSGQQQHQQQHQQQQQQEAPAGRRKVLLVWFGRQDTDWRWQDELLPYEEHAKAKSEEAHTLDEAGRLPSARLWHQAHWDANECLRLKKGEAAAANDGDLIGRNHAAWAEAAVRDRGYRDALTSRAARQAARVNTMSRCNQCEACTQSNGSTQRRCLVVRAAAAAANGHAGAQLSVLEEKGIGAKVSVWWPLDEAWYTGTVTDFDRLRMRHTVHYEDGDVELIPLWAPHQLVRVLTRPGDWVAEAARLAAAAEKEANRRQAAAKAARMHVGAVLETQQEVAAATLLERDRAARMAVNKQRMHDIMGAPETNADDADDTADVAAAVGEAVAGKGAQGTAAAAAVAGVAAVNGEVAAGPAVRRPPGQGFKMETVKKLHQGAPARGSAGAAGGKGGDGNGMSAAAACGVAGGGTSSGHGRSAAADGAGVGNGGHAGNGAADRVDTAGADADADGQMTEARRTVAGDAEMSDSGEDEDKAPPKPNAAAEVLAALAAAGGGKKRKGGSRLLEEAVQAGLLCDFGMRRGAKAAAAAAIAKGQDLTAAQRSHKKAKAEHAAPAKAAAQNAAEAGGAAPKGPSAAAAASAGPDAAAAAAGAVVQGFDAAGEDVQDLDLSQGCPKKARTERTPEHPGSAWAGRLVPNLLG